ncbi:hypothetical protein PS3A_02010 [Pseudomonas sp. 3A(2025)]
MKKDTRTFRSPEQHKNGAAAVCRRDQGGTYTATHEAVWRTRIKHDAHLKLINVSENITCSERTKVCVINV